MPLSREPPASVSSPSRTLGAEASQRRTDLVPVMERLYAVEGSEVHALRLDEVHKRLHGRVVPRTRHEHAPL